MMYSLEYGKEAARKLKKMPKNVSFRISSKLKALAESPFQAANVKQLSGEDDVYRLRVADWRIIYIIEETRLIIHIQSIKARGEVYKR